MASAEGSFLGLAKQTVKGTPITTDASFEYLLFTDGAFGPQNIFLPLPNEIGGGALQRSVIKAGVSTGGALNFVPRPATLGHILYGLTGAVTTTADTPTAGYHTHAFQLNLASQFDAPYYTVRYAPADLWGEQYPDVRFNMLSLDFVGANFVRGSFGFMGSGEPSVVSTAAWGAAAKVDGGPQLIAPVSVIELPDGTPASVLSGSFVALSNIPMDEQFVVGSYSPDGVDIVSRAYMLTMAIKISDKNLYEQMMYDPAQSGAWLAKMYREADFQLDLVSDAANIQLSIAGNGRAEADGDANVYWTAAPIGLRAQRQVVMQVTGMFVASTATAPNDDPITLTLVNQKASY